MSEKRIVGVSPWSNPNYAMMKDVGIEWVRVNIPVPFVEKMGGEFNPEFLKVIDEVKAWNQNGFRVMGVTPLAGMNEFDEATGQQMVWHRRMPEWAGPTDGDLYYEAYEEICEYIADYTRDMISMWQVSNEMDLALFRGPLSKEEAARFMLAGGRGVKKGNPDAKPGINPTTWGPSAEDSQGRWLVETLYQREDCPFEYVGTDGYFGSWGSGGPQNWIVRIDEMYEVAKKPILINEWGYGSLGGPAKAPVKMGKNTVCSTKAFHHVWKKEHSEEEQAEYIKTTLKIFATYPNVLGSFFYSWGDSPTCWHCGSSTCPAECGWGIVDSSGKPKLSYEAFKDTVHKYY